MRLVNHLKAMTMLAASGALKVPLTLGNPLPLCRSKHKQRNRRVKAKRKAQRLARRIRRKYDNS